MFKWFYAYSNNALSHTLVQILIKLKRSIDFSSSVFLSSSPCLYSFLLLSSSSLISSRHVAKYFFTSLIDWVTVSPLVHKHILGFLPLKSSFSYRVNLFFSFEFIWRSLFELIINLRIVIWANTWAPVSGLKRMVP